MVTSRESRNPYIDIDSYRRRLVIPINGHELLHWGSETLPRVGYSVPSIKMAGKKMTESNEQKQLIQWCRLDSRFQYLFHIPNESVGGQGWLIRNRQMGVKPGVPDLFYPIPLNGYHGLFIEMKADKGRLSKEQKRWFDVLTTLGYKCVVAHGWEEARDALIEYTK